MRYYKYSKQKKGWILIKGNQAYGTCPHSAVLYAGIEYNLNNTMKAHCLEHLQAVVDWCNIKIIVNVLKQILCNLNLIVGFIIKNTVVVLVLYTKYKI